MNAAARSPASLPTPSSSSARTPPSRRGKRERRAFRRSDVMRYQPQELAWPPPSSSWQRGWERYAIPGGLAMFWLVFLVSNWSRLTALLGLG